MKIRKIKDFVKENNLNEKELIKVMTKNQTKDIIENVLNEIGIKIIYEGYIYWTELVRYCIEDLDYNNYKMLELYEYLKEHFNKTNWQIERALRYSMQNATENLNEKFNVKYKITNKSFLMLLIKETKRRMGK